MPVAIQSKIDHLEMCKVSAEFWATHLPQYSARMQSLADNYAISASLISAVTGLGVWGMMAKSPHLWAQVVVGLMAFAASVVAVIPTVKHYGDCAANARQLSTEYGDALGDIVEAMEELQAGASEGDSNAKAALAKFQDVRARKSALNPFPQALQDQVNKERDKAGVLKM